MLFEAILSATILGIIMAMSVSHLPVWLKRMIMKTPIWIQCAILHFGYAAWLGGVTGHLMGAPLAIIWFAVWEFYLKSKLEIECAHAATDSRSFIRAIRDKVRGAVARGRSFAGEVREELAVPATV